MELKKQDIVAQSTAEGEFIGVAAAVNQVLWIRKFLIDLNIWRRTRAQRFLLTTKLP